MIPEETYRVNSLYINTYNNKTLHISTCVIQSRITHHIKAFVVSPKSILNYAEFCVNYVVHVTRHFENSVSFAKRIIT